MHPLKMVASPAMLPNLRNDCTGAYPRQISSAALSKYHEDCIQIVGTSRSCLYIICLVRAKLHHFLCGEVKVSLASKTLFYLTSRVWAKL